MTRAHDARPARPRDRPAASVRTEQLLRDGYCIIRNAVPVPAATRLRAELASRFAATPFCQGDFYGWRTKRFHGLLKRSERAARFVTDPLVLGIVDMVLGPHCDTVQLNLTQALELHPGERAQVPHRDQDMWGGRKGDIEYLVNVIWPLTAFRRENGATLVWPGSHRRQDERRIVADEAIAAEMDPGSALVFLGSTLHGAGANRTGAPRAAIIVSYCLGWLKPYENQWLTYPPDVARGFAPAVAKLVGYCQHRPNLGNFDGQCPSILLDGPPPDALAAIDALPPEREAALRNFLREQEAAV